MDPMVESAWIAAGAAVVGVVGTATVAIVGYWISRKTNQATIDAAEENTDKTIAAAHADIHSTLDATREGQFADRYSRALEQLGSDNLDIRRGGIYAMEGIAVDSVRYHPIVMEVLTAFIREHSYQQRPPSDHAVSGGQERSTRPDVQAALTVVGRRDPDSDIRSIDLSGAFLAGADLAHAILAHADLAHAILRDAILAHADLGGADLAGANLTGAWLAGANLTSAFLAAADLTSAFLAGAGWPEDTPVPGGWQRDTDSGRLKSAAGEPMSHAVPPGAGDRAIVLLSKWAEGRYDDVTANFDATMTAKFPTAAVWTQTVGLLGTYKRMMGEPFVRQLDDHTLVDVPMEFESDVIKGRVVFNADGQVSGLFILNPDHP